ncbi:MAG: hypothetical protein E7495_05775 [Ruminococcus flavefaciens]|jgi:hypothetical protein|nr:hypothetical protein [Ruminococcus flavefaciens]
MKTRKIAAAAIAALCAIGSVGYVPLASDNSSVIVSQAEEAAKITVWDGTSDTTWYDDEETEFHLTTAEQLAGVVVLSTSSKKDFKNKTIYLENDLYLNESDSQKNSWIPIGKSTTFSGTFDGKGHYIYNYYSAKNGMFDNVGGKIMNINFVNATISTTEGNVGGICRYAANIENCYFSGKISGGLDGTSTNKYYIGGICGKGSATDCVFSGEIRSNKKYTYCGGICGYSTVNPKNCASYGEISSAFGAGGISGRVTSGPINNCFNYAKVTGGNYAGGIFGYTSERFTMNSCYNRGIVTGDEYNGGVFGYDDYDSTNVHEIANIYNSGNVSGSSCGAIYGICNERGYLKTTNVYYLNTTAKSAAYNKADPTGVYAKTEANMKTEKFAGSLGGAYVYVPNDFSHLAIEKENVHLRFDKPSLRFDSFDKTEQLKLWENDEGEITWLSSDPEVAIVDIEGVVKPVGNGNALIYALYGDSKAVCDVTVSAYSLDKESLSMNIGAFEKLTVYSNKTAIDPAKVAFASSDAKVATVAKDGTVKAIGEGSCDITASINGNKYVCKVTVSNEIEPTSEEPVTESLRLDKDSLTLTNGDEDKITVLNYSGSITWISSDTQVVKVAKGEGNTASITTVGAGEATIYAMLSTGKNLTCQVTVKEAGTEISKIRGDANCDFEVNMSDVVMIMQSYLNPAKYGEKGTSSERIKPQGIINGDVDTIQGLNLQDALRIQEYILKLLDSL